MNHTPDVRSTYLRAILEPSLVKFLIESLEAGLRTLDFQAIAFSGMSGALAAPLLAMLMDRSLILVRKEVDVVGHHCHSTNMVEGDRAATRYVIVDDRVSSGATVRHIIKQISEWHPRAVCVGIGLYDPDIFSPGDVDNIPIF